MVDIVPDARPAAPVRLAYLDVARVLAIFGVVAIHTWSFLTELEPGTAHWWAVDVVLQASRWAVPVFVMISGGLVLAPRPGQRTSELYRRRLPRVGVPALFWIASYLVFRATFLHQDLTAQIVLSDLIAGQPFTHLYFLYVIVGLYLVTPIFRPFVATASRQALGLASAGLLAVWAINTALPYALGPDAGVGVNGLTYWIPFVGYYLAGRALFGLRLERVATRSLTLAIALALGVQILSVPVLARIGDGAWQLYPISYFSVFTIASALLIYASCARASPGQEMRGISGRIAATLGGATFGVYLVHEMILYWHTRTFVAGPIEAQVDQRIATYVVTIVAGFVVVLIAQRTRGLRRLV